MNNKRNLNRNSDKPRAERREDVGMYKVVPATNSIYRDYYKLNGIFRNDADENEFMDILSTELPATFRLHSTDTSAESFVHQLENELSQGYPMKLDAEVLKRCLCSGRKNTPGVIADGPKRISWYPNNHGWKCGTSRTIMRKAPQLKGLHNFVYHESEAGYLTRQEEASMIPPFFLDVKPEHFVLDMCASPGSKTAQILEALHCDDFSTGKFEPPSGLLVANDMSRDRAYLLSHQLKRIPSPNLIITNHDGKMFPSIPKFLDMQSHGFFDRILADVPCSGDGTIRKSPDIWRRWDPFNGMDLHKVQTLVAQRCVQVLKVGGLMVYSTCSLNPIENEAVVAALLRANEGALELVDTSGTLPSLKRRSGLDTWILGRSSRVSSELKQHGVDGSEGQSLEVFTSKEDYEAKTKDEKDSKKAPHTVWPPTCEEEKQAMHLERCMRIMPNDQDTSGFFVCLIKKVKESRGDVNFSKEYPPLHESLAAPPQESKNCTPSSEETTKSDDALERDDYFFPISDETWDTINTYYGFTENLKDCFMTRVGEGRMIQKKNKKTKVEDSDELISKNITYVSPSVRRVINGNTDQKLHIVTAGCNVMRRDRVHFDGKQIRGYRIQSDSIGFFLSKLTKKVVRLTLEDLFVFTCGKLFVTEDPVKQARFNQVCIIPPEYLSPIAKCDERGSVIGTLVDEDAAKYIKMFGERFSCSFFAGSRGLNPMFSRNDAQQLNNRLSKSGLVSTEFIGSVDAGAMLEKGAQN